jgi:release factor glutamine methyltransferase
MAEPRTARELVEESEARLRRSPAIEHEPPQRDRWESELLLSHALGLDGEEPDPTAEVDGVRRRRFRTLVRRRAGGEPMPHILGWTEFRELRLSVRPGAFVPRQSSEFLAEQAVRRLRGRRRAVAVDLATGIGPVALAVAHEAPRTTVHASDQSAAAVRQGRANARSLGLRNVTFYTGDLFRPLPASLRGGVDVITVHPPYVPRDEVEDLPLEVKGFEPEDTLTDYSPHGMGLAERTAEEADAWLRPGGWLLVEVSPDRARLVRALLARCGYREVRSTKGWPGVTRVIVGRR